MPRLNLTNYQINKIKAKIEDVYEKAKLSVLGSGKFADDLTLTGMFNSASREERNTPDENSLKSLIKIAEGYIDSQKELTKTRVVQVVDAALKSAQNKDIGPSGFEDLILKNLIEVFNKAADDMRRIIDTEANNVKNIGLLDGIIKVNATSGIEDPVVYFSCPWDDKTCDECLKLHFYNGGPIFRLWYLSELKTGYSKRGDNTPAIGGQHPHCRASIATLMPSFGFDKAGTVVYITSGHSEIKKQRGSL